MKLSILIPTLHSRSHFFQKLYADLTSQIVSGSYEDAVEIRSVIDQKEKTIGEKRNILLEASKGDFVVFVDDDDRVSEDYISEIMKCIDADPDADCIVFDCICTINAHKPDGGRQFYSRYGIEYELTKLEPWGPHNCQKREKMEEWFGKPAHTMVYAARIAKRCKFPHLNSGEDFAWVNQAWVLVKKQIRINKVLYYYDVVLGKKY